MTEQNNQIQNQKIILVLDTSWLMEIGKKDYNVLMDLLKPPKVEIRIHNRVFKELDGLKNVEGKSLQARRVSQYLEEALNTYKDRVQISDFGIKQPAEKFASALQSEVDAIVLTLAEMSKKENKNTVLLTTDRNQRILWEKDNEIHCILKELNEKQGNSKKGVKIALITFISLAFIIGLSIKFQTGIFWGATLIALLTIAFIGSFFVDDNTEHIKKRVFLEIINNELKDDNNFELHQNQKEEEKEDEHIWGKNCIITDPKYSDIPGNIGYSD